jgi:hypothetical protein
MMTSHCTFAGKNKEADIGNGIRKSRQTKLGRLEFSH